MAFMLVQSRKFATPKKGIITMTLGDQKPQSQKIY